MGGIRETSVIVTQQFPKLGMRLEFLLYDATMRTLLNSGNETKPMMHTRYLIVTLLFLAGCSGSNSPRAPSDDSPQGNAGVPEEISPHRNFEYPFFEPQNCPEDPIFNCTADLTLCEDGSSYIILSDIINSGTYTQTGTTIVSSWGVGDVPPEITFAIQSDGSLTDDAYGFTWVPVVAGDFPGFCEEQ